MSYNSKYKGNEVETLLDKVNTINVPTKVSELENDIPFATGSDLNAKLDKVLKFANLSAANWVSDSTYNDYPYRCDLQCNGVTSEMYAEVVFSVMQANGGDYAPICETKTNVVSIWSKYNVTISVPTVIITK